MGVNVCGDHISRDCASLKIRCSLPGIFPWFSCSMTHFDISTTEELIAPAGAALSKSMNGTVCSSKISDGFPQILGRFLAGIVVTYSPV